MKLIDIINKRCNCKVTQIIITSPLGERIAYKDIPNDDKKCYDISLQRGNIDLVITYSADEKLSDDAVSLLTDLIDVYVENRATWEIAENVTKSPDINTGRVNLEEMVKVTTNALVYSGLFDKAAVMFFNEKRMEFRGVYMSFAAYICQAYRHTAMNRFRHLKIKECLLKNLLLNSYMTIIVTQMI